MPCPTKSSAILVFAALMAAGGGATAADDRELVTLPPPMQEHMMANMRDHLRSLEEIMTALAGGRPKDAADIAEQRIGMSSLTLHGAEHMGPFMPEPMRRMGSELHRASSRFGLAVEEADLEPGAAGAQKVYGTLAEMMAACNGCHTAYRIR